MDKGRCYMPKGLKKLGFMVANSKCNANCSFCAGKIHRTMKPPNFELFKTILEDSPDLMEVTISGAGEPLLHYDNILKTLEILQSFSNITKIKLYTNGINLQTYKLDLEKYKEYGLTHLYMSIHSMDMEENKYSFSTAGTPTSVVEFKYICDQIGLIGRLNILLIQGLIDTPVKLNKIIKTCDKLSLLYNYWGIRDINDQRESWVYEQFPNLPSNKYDESNKTLFPNDILLSSWC